jgi:hypothetical protein
MNGRCATCLHWERDRETQYIYADGSIVTPDRRLIAGTMPRPGAAVISTRRQPVAWGACERATSDSGRPLDPDSLAQAKDYEAYSAYLLTHETFGCTQFEPREVDK